MVKKESYSLNLLAELSRFFYVENLEPFDVLASFLDLVTRELGADYSFLISNDSHHVFHSSGANIAVIGHYRDEAFINSCDLDEDLSLGRKLAEGISLHDLTQLDGELRVWDLQHWGKLYIKFPAKYTQRAILEEMTEMVIFLSVFMYSIEIKERGKLISGLTSELRKTLRPDLALEKISKAMNKFLGTEQLHFFRKLGDDGRGSKYELYYPSPTLEKGTPKLWSYEQIQNYDYLPENYKPEIFEAKVRDKVWGLMVLAKPSKWTSLHSSLVRPFAEQIATVFNQNELHNESLSMAQREFLLNQVTTTIRDSLDVDQIIKIASQEIAQVMGVDACGIIILNRRMKGKDQQSVWSPTEDMSDKMNTLLQESMGTIYAPNLDNQSVNVGDFSSEKADVAKFFSNELGLKSYLACGLYRDSGKELIGVISIALYSQTRKFTQGEQQLLESISKQVEMALMQAAIYQESQQTKRQMALLYKLSSDIRDSLDISVVLGQIASNLGEVMGLSRCFVRRLSIDNKVLKTEQEFTATGISPSADIMFGFERAWIEKLAQQNSLTSLNEYISIPNVKGLLKKENSSLARIAESISLKSYLAIPLIARGRVLGTINIHQCDRERNFLPEEIEFITRVGSEAAIAIEHAELFETIDRLNKMDPDTGLYNRRYFRIIAEREITKAAEEKRDISFIMLDLDHLKEINDSLGHDAGDEAIMIVAKVLENTVRQTPVDELRSRISDIVGRYGGDEYMILLPNTSLENAIRAAARITANLKKVRPKGWDRELTCSIGIAGTPNDGYDYEELKRKADQALYLSKAKGRNGASSSLEL